MTRLAGIGVGLAALLLLFVGTLALVPRLAGSAISEAVRGPPPETVIQSTLSSLQREQQLVVLSAGVLGKVTSTQERRLGTARKTMLVPGVVRYAIDLSALAPDDLAWDPDRRLLTVRRPPLLLLGPEIDPALIEEYAEIGFLPGLLGAEALLDAANRAEARRAVLVQARGATLMALARESADTALARTFAVPLAAAGLPDVRVAVVDGSTGRFQPATS